MPSSTGYLHRKVHRIDMKPTHQVRSTRKLHIFYLTFIQTVLCFCYQQLTSLNYLLEINLFIIVDHEICQNIFYPFVRLAHSVLIYVVTNLDFRFPRCTAVVSLKTVLFSRSKRTTCLPMIRNRLVLFYVVNPAYLHRALNFSIDPGLCCPIENRKVFWYRPGPD